ncbi:MAG: hypothetical protein E6K65_16375 [Nitrospirae bacterium]|nr:MAG: hypothetical protein E6K65_16375 [Nitrospirota bacterium]
MKPAAEKTLALALAVGMVIGLIIWGPAEHSVQAAEQTGETSRNVESATPTWSGGAAVGFLSNTPDGTAFAFNLHADRFLQRNVSLGPLVQLGFTGDLTQVGFSGQGKYWIDLPKTNNRAKVVLQAGIGFRSRGFFSKRYLVVDPSRDRG